ncbi:hypothetical protein ACFV7Q_27900 [Streptomyces sp. NPDC059851]|uniref:hypothetical protein n=1 Tax=Streptomyces sp. NPDC059851 TaxID=3346971 RepID=UPI00364C70F4
MPATTARTSNGPPENKARSAPSATSRHITNVGPVRQSFMPHPGCWTPELDHDGRGGPPEATFRKIQPHHQLYVYCQKQGQNIGGNPYWLLVNDYTDSNTGWIASYYIAYPDNRLPDVPDC